MPIYRPEQEKEVRRKLVRQALEALQMSKDQFSE